MDYDYELSTINYLIYSNFNDLLRSFDNVFYSVRSR